MDELLQRVAELKGMPASLVERSAQARAEKTGTTLEAVLREWAGEDQTSSSQVTDDDAQPAAKQETKDDSQSETEEAPGAVVITTDYLVQLAAEAKRMPPKLILSSATARAEHSNASLEEVLANWAGTDLETLKSQAPADSPQPPSEPEAPEAIDQPTDEGQQEPEAPKAAVAAVAATALSMDELLEKVVEVKGMPAALAKRSAEARSNKTGEPVEAVLAEWAGVELPTGDSQPAAPAEPEAPKAAVAAVAATALSMDELLEKVVEVKGMPAALAKRSAEARSNKTGEPVEAVLAEWAGVELPTGDSQPAVPAQGVTTSKPDDEAPTPSGDSEDEPGPEVIEAAAVQVEGPAEDEDVPVVRGGYPKWLAAAFVLIPLLAVVYILVAPNGPDCGTAGQLLVDPVTGETLNCDGTEYGSSSVDYFAEGAGVYTQCVACHGADGSGGAGPAFAGGAVLATFPSGSCSDHQEWVRLGTAGWPDATYGANGKPVGGFGLMPSFASMSDEDLAAVVLYERVQFGGQPLEEALTDCGLDEASEDTAEAAGP
jgi:mono/diheme cytochrome c family protein